MPFVVKQSLIEKTFIKVGQQLGDDLDLSSSQNAVDFLSGFVDSLQKEAHMNPSQALGFIKYITEIGYNDSVDKKTASVEDGEELDELFDKMQEKLSGLLMKSAAEPVQEMGLNPLNWPKNHAIIAGQAATDRAFSNAQGMIGKAWDHLKSPEFLSQVAPYAIGALGGYLLPKMLGGGGNGLVNAGLGAAAIGGGAYLANKYNLTDPKTWAGFKDKAMSFMGGGQQKQGEELTESQFKGQLGMLRPPRPQNRNFWESIIPNRDQANHDEIGRSITRIAKNEGGFNEWMKQHTGPDIAPSPFQRWKMQQRLDTTGIGSGANMPQGIKGSGYGENKPSLPFNMPWGIKGLATKAPQ